MFASSELFLLFDAFDGIISKRNTLFVFVGHFILKYSLAQMQ